MFIRRIPLSRIALIAWFAGFTISLSAFASDPSPTKQSERSSPERVSADTPRTTPAGATFMVPGGWSIVTTKNMVILEPPDPDTHVAIFDAQASDAKGAVTAAWAAYKPEFKRPLKLVTPRPAHEGWDERQIFQYETSPNERAVVQAIALRAGTAWTVIILEGTDPTRVVCRTQGASPRCGTCRSVERVR